jgi:uncharacterized protein (TIGR02284 family)
MTNRVPQAAQDIKPETIESLQELIYALRDSVNYHTEAADKIDDKFVESEFLAIAAERKDISETIGGFISLADEKSEEEGTWLGSLRTIWTAFRAGLNSGDATVVLIEAERAEDVIKGKFEKVLPEIAGNPVNDMLMKYYQTVKAGHDRVLAMRNAYQNA